MQSNLRSSDATVGPQLAAACYVCELARVPGCFLPKKAAELGVPSGPLYGQLKRGEAVTLENGTVIQPHLVGILELSLPLMPRNVN